MNEISITSALDVVSFLEANDGKLVINIATDAVGHVVGEFDNFARMRLTGEISPQGGHLYMGPVEERVATIAEMYGDSLCASYMFSPLAPEIVRSIALFRPDLTVDVGYSSYKVAPIEGRTTEAHIFENSYFSYTKPLGFLEDVLACYRRRLQTFDTHVMARKFDMPADLERFIDARGKRIALIQIKDFASSGGAEAINPDCYRPAMEYLRDLGYQLVMVGREGYPEIFSRLGVIDYANSPLASFKNDLILFSNANFCLLGPSGISLFAEVMNIPFVFVNHWCPNVPPFPPYCVNVPALARSRRDGSLMSFKEQLKLMYTYGVYFPSEVYEPVSPDGNDILMGTQEALGLEENLTLLNENQARYKQLAPDSSCAVALSRVSAAFLERHQDLL